MPKITKGQLITLIIFVLICTYFASGILVFVLNKYSIFDLGKYYSLGFTYDAIIKQYPKINISILYCFLFFTILVIPIPFFAGKNKHLHGNARFAKDYEIKKSMKLLEDKGLIVGKYKGKFLRFPGQQFVALGAPTRSGKGVGIVIPNLLDWNESCVVQDIKQECFDYTSKYRKEILKQDVFLFNPFSTKTHKYNPLYYVDMYDEIYRDSQLTDLANILYPTNFGDSTTVFFNQQAQQVFIGLCYLYHDLETKGQEFLQDNDIKIHFTLWGILDLSDGFNISYEDGEEEATISGFDETIEYLEYLEILSTETKKRLTAYLTNGSANTKSGIMASFNAPLLQFRSEPMKTALSGNDFDLRDLRKKKMTIYIGILPDQLANAKLILNVFWSQLLLLNTKELPQKNKDLKYPCLLLLDEFTAPGYIPILQKGVSFIAGYNLRLMTIFQSISQLETSVPDGYGKEGAKTLLTNHACQIFYTPREQEDAEKISKILGTTTVKNVSRSYNHGKGFEIGSSSRNVSEAQRALMMPQELREMAFDEELITIDNGKPILCNKAFYYNDSYFMDKYKMIAPSLKNIKGIPNRNEFESAILNNETNIEIPNQIQGGF